MRLVDELKGRQDEFARLLTMEQGKPLSEVHWEIDFTIAIIRHYAALDLPDEILKDDAKQKIVRQRMPLGVVAAIVSRNFPMLPQRDPSGSPKRRSSTWLSRTNRLLVTVCEVVKIISPAGFESALLRVARQYSSYVRGRSKGGRRHNHKENKIGSLRASTAPTNNRGGYRRDQIVPRPQFKMRGAYVFGLA